MSDFLRTFFSTLFSSLQTGSVTALAALGIVLIFRTSKTTNFAQGSIGTFNAFIAAWILRNQGYSIWTTVFLALIAAFIMGIVIDRLIIRPASKVSPIAKQIITLGIIMIITGLIPMIFRQGQMQDGQTITYTMSRFISREGAYIQIFGLFSIPRSFSVFGATLTLNVIFTVTLSILLMGLSFWFIQKTKWGLATRVTASSETTSRLMGVPTGRVTMISWAVAAMFGALAAIILAPQVSMTETYMINTQINAFFAGVLGGFQTFYGPVIGAYIIIFVLNYMPLLLGSFWSQADIWSSTIVFVLIMVFLYFKPYGLFGKKPIKKV